MNKAVLFLLCIFLIGCSKTEKDAHEDSHDDHEEKNAVHLKVESQRLIGLEKTVARKGALTKSVELVGEIAQDTENAIHITCPEAGLLKQCLVRVGDTVEKDTPLCVVATNQGMREIKSPAHGIVLAQYTKEGEAVDSLSSILTIADPDLMRASFNVYEKDLPYLSLGRHVTVRTAAYPDREFKGEVVFISPRVDSETRMIKVRVNIMNEEHLLKLGMFVTGILEIPSGKEALIIPLDAVQKVEEKTVVFLSGKNGEDEFLMKEVRLGEVSQTEAEAAEGLSEGDEIVTKGSFYLKSELLKSELEEGHGH